MPLRDNSNTYAGVGVGVSGVGSLVSILAFAMPYWIYYEEDLTLSDVTGSYQVQFTYYYGFWKYCNKVLSDISNSDSCGSVDTHSDVEQTTACLLMLSILLFASAVVNGCLYLTLFKKQRLCLYIAWISVVVAGVLALTSLIIYARTDHSVTVTNNITLNFSASKLHASFWLLVVGCFMVAIATIFLTLAIISARRSDDKSEDKTSMFSSDSVEKPFNEEDDISEEYKYKDAGIPEAFPYTDSPYSTSSESLSEVDDACDSDDSDIHPEFAKLKVKLTPKPSGVKSVEADTLEFRRCKSGEPPGIVSSTTQVASSLLFRSRSASALTPVEQNVAPLDIAAEKIRVMSEKQQIVNMGPNNYDNNPLYIDTTKPLEAGTAPVATNLIFAIPRPLVDASDEFALRRAKTDMPFTQRMRDTIDHSNKEPHPTDDQEQSIREPAEIVNLPPLPFKRKSPLKKTKKSKAKLKKPSEEERRRKKELTDVYTAPTAIKTFFPGQKPAPWSKGRAKFGTHPKNSKSFKWSLEAYGSDIATLKKQLQKARRKHRVSSSVDDSVHVETMDENVETMVGLSNAIDDDSSVV